MREIGKAMAKMVLTSYDLERSLPMQKTIYSLIRNRLTHEKVAKLMFVHRSLKIWRGSTSAMIPSTSLFRVQQGAEKSVLHRTVCTRASAAWMRWSKTLFLASPAPAVVIEEFVSVNPIVSAHAAEIRNVHGLNTGVVFRLI